MFMYTTFSYLGSRCSASVNSAAERMSENRAPRMAQFNPRGP